MVNDDIIYREITAADSAAVIDLANRVHGDNYLNEGSLAALLAGGTVGSSKLNFLAERNGELLGIRLTLAPGNWSVDKACTPEQWPVAAEQICYFKCAAVAEQARGLGIGKQLLQKSIDAATDIGCRAGLAHIWLQSPANSAYEYFTRCGGIMVNRHPDRWLQASLEDGYYCPVCDGTCRCDAGEMILPFDA